MSCSLRSGADGEAVNKFRIPRFCDGKFFLLNRGFCANSIYSQLRGGRSQAIFQNAFRNASVSATTPSAPQRRLRDIFLMSRPPLLCEEGSISPKDFVKKIRFH